VTNPRYQLALLLALGVSGCNFSEALERCRQGGRCPDDPVELVPGPAHAISGFVSGAVQLGVSLRLEGPGKEVPRVTTTDSLGHYVFEGLADGVFSITPSAEGFAFTPPRRDDVTVDHADVGGQDFTAARTTPGTVSPTASVIRYVSGDLQSGVVGAALSRPLVVKVADSNGDPVINHAVWWTSDGGTVPAKSSTDDAGHASVIATLGPAVGTITFQATAAGLSGAPVLFTATGTSGPAAGLARVSGDGQQATYDSTLPQPLVVQVTDASGAPASGVAVTWAALGGGRFSSVSMTTDELGQASATATLGPSPGRYTFEASVDGLAGSPVSFSGFATAGAPSAIEPESGDGQVGAVGASLSRPLVVKVTDSKGYAVTSFAVQWTSDGGAVPMDSSTDDAGHSSVTATLGPAPGTITFQATAGGLSGSPVVFTAAALAGPAAKLVYVAGNPSDACLSPFPLLVVKVTDTYGNPVAGQTVQWTRPNGTQRSTSTGDDGLASFKPDMALSPYTVQASAPAGGGTALAGSPVTFTVMCGVLSLDGGW